MQNLTGPTPFSAQTYPVSNVYVHAAAGMGVSVAELRGWTPEETRRRSLEGLRVIEGHIEVLARQRDAPETLMMAARRGGRR
jgi:hypothetical protein